MKESTKRSVLRCLHIAFGLPIFGYVYGPPQEVAQYVNMFRFIFVPGLLLSGLWMWKGPAIRRMFTKSERP